MSRYEITVELIEKYTMTLKADSQSDACEKAEEILVEQESAKERYHNDSETRSTAIELN